MIRLKQLDEEHPVFQEYFYLAHLVMLANQGNYDQFVFTLLNISFLAKKISRYGLGAVLNDLELAYSNQDYRLRALKHILIQAQDQLTFSQEERDIFGVLHSLLTHQPDFIELVAREEISGNVELPVLTTLQPIANLPGTGDFVPRQIIKAKPGLILSRAAAISPNGRFLALATQEVEIWDLSTRKKIHTIFPEGQISSLAFSPDSENLLASTTDGTNTIWDRGCFLRIWHLREISRQHILETHQGSINRACFGPGRDTIYSASDDMTLIKSNAETGKILFRIENQAPVKSCLYSETRNIVYSISNDAALHAWDGTSGQLLFSLPSPHGNIQKITLGRGENLIATFYEDGSLGIWELSEHKEMLHLAINEVHALDGALAEERDRILVIYSDRTIRVWELSSGELKASLVYSYLEPADCMINPLGDCIIRFRNGDVHVWEPGRLFEIHGNHSPDKEKYVQHLYNQRNQSGLFLPWPIRDCHPLQNGKFIAIDRDRKTKLWDSRNGQIDTILDVGISTVFCSSERGDTILFLGENPNGMQDEKRLQRLNLQKNTHQHIPIVSRDKHTPIASAMSGDEKYCVVGFSEGVIELHDLETGQLKAQLLGHPRAPQQISLLGLPPYLDIHQCAIAPENDFFATIAHLDSCVEIRDIPAGNLIHQLQVENVQSYRFISFTRKDGLFLAVGTSRQNLSQPDETFIQIWQMPDFTSLKRFSLGQAGEHQYMAAISLHPEGRFLAIAWSDGQVCIWDVTNGNRVSATHLSDELGTCAWSDTNILMVGGVKGAYFLWLVTDLQEWRRFGRGIFNTGYQPRVHYFGDASIAEKESEKLAPRLKTGDQKAITESILYKAELDCITGSEKTAIVLNNAGLHLARLEDFEAAQTLFDKIKTRDLARLNDLEKGVITFNFGQVEYHLNHIQRATSLFQDALAIFEKLRSKAWRAKVINSLATIQYQQQDYQACLDSYLTAMQLYEKSRNWNEATELKAKISQVYKQLKDPEQSLTWMTAYFHDLQRQS